MSLRENVRDEFIGVTSKLQKKFSTADSKSIRYNLENDMIEFSARTSGLSEKNVPDAAVIAMSAMKSGDVPPWTCCQFETDAAHFFSHLHINEDQAISLTYLNNIECSDHNKSTLSANGMNIYL